VLGIGLWRKGVCRTRNRCHNGFSAVFHVLAGAQNQPVMGA
jgi:hypothetical protein